MTSKSETKLTKWGNSLAIRIPKDLLEQLDMKEQDTVEISQQDGAIVINPKQTAIQELLRDYDKQQPYPFDIVDKGEPVGKELI
ncbi:hypothetical protein C5L31_000941 [Secundilactobacillus malefermentans]|uniref:SpoVT-AbrB domain-containing protein n=2 Tax=Secundilactobacillus malefermentans TaxID=176292 RepID=A0A4R5NHV9_9LACO|nr:AbrB/MazE/SpoVT family DNA-binding domain-containing protein [Secundilactobacillus malefermentans]TDG73694.1 hypothetical protein C5L31_000941 [Secundilactobacillus malefermentans]